MSELTACNYCNLRWIRKRAKVEGKKVILRPSRDGWGGTVVLLKDRKTNKEKWICWFMELSNNCCC